MSNYSVVIYVKGTGAGVFLRALQEGLPRPKALKTANPATAEVGFEYAVRASGEEEAKSLGLERLRADLGDQQAYNKLFSDSDDISITVHS